VSTATVAFAEVSASEPGGGDGEESPSNEAETGDRGPAGGGPDAPGEEDGAAAHADDAAGWGDGDDDEAGWGEKGENASGGKDGTSDDVGFGEREEDAGEGGIVPSKKASDEASGETRGPSPWSVVGFSRSDLGFWVERLDKNGFAKARQSLDLSARYKIKSFRAVASVHGEYDFAYLYHRDTHDAATLDTYEYLIDVRDTYLVAAIGNLDIALGKQIVVWGQGNMMSLVDVVCPKDLREPGLTDMDDMRLPVLSTRLSLFFGNHRVETMVIHEAFFGYRAPPFGDYSPLPALLPEEVLDTLEGVPIWYKDKQARFNLKNQQYLGRWTYKGPEVDLELYLASVLDGMGVIDLDYTELLSSIINGRRAEIVLDHPRYTMLGHSGAWPIGAWLLKWELAVDLDRPLNVGDSTAVPLRVGIARSSTIGGLIGFTYTGFKDTVLSLEVKKSWILEDIPDVLFDIEEPTLGFRCRRNLGSDDLRLDFTLLMYGWGLKYGWLGRLLMEYVIRDGLRITAGYITYYPGHEFGLLSGMAGNDRFYMQLRWDFSIL
jgi:hypothetical protein